MDTAAGDEAAGRAERFLTSVNSVSCDARALTSALSLLEDAPQLARAEPARGGSEARSGGERLSSPSRPRPASPG